MRKVTLSEICDISSGGTPSRSNPDFFRGDIPWAKISDIENAENGVVYTTEERISAEGLNNIRGKLFSKGTLLFAMYGSIGKVAIAGKELSTNQAILGVRPKADDQIDVSYLKCWFESNKQKLINQGRGVALKNLSATIVRNLEIQLPPFDDQKRIAHLLGKVEGLIDQRKENQQLLDELLKNVFLEMFGPKNPEFESWPLVEIKELAADHRGAMRTGPFGSNLLHSEFTAEGDVAVLGIDNAVQNQFAWGERRYITNEKYKELESYQIFPGDVIVTIMGTIGRSAVIPDDIPLAINTKHLAAITLNRKVANPIFLSYSIHSSPYVINQFNSKNHGAIMSGLNLTIIKETKIRRPPVERQNDFAVIHQRIDGIKSRYQQSLSELENLYGALSQKAFKGELDLSRVDLPTDVREDVTPVAPVVSEVEPKPAMHLPAPEDKYSLFDAEGRMEVIGQWLDSYLEQLGGNSFIAENFMECAQQRLWEILDDDAYKLSVSEYDYLKQWLFNELDKGRISQELNITSKPGEGFIYGNQILLKKAQ
jgi:type I restriction enzyme, S subunit